jgi:hypothetical protein
MVGEKFVLYVLLCVSKVGNVLAITVPIFMDLYVNSKRAHEQMDVAGSPVENPIPVSRNLCYVKKVHPARLITGTQQEEPRRNARFMRRHVWSRPLFSKLKPT